MARRYCYNEILPLTAMVGVEGANVGVNILFKEATSKGMSHYIFITYSYALGALLLLPLCFFFPSRAVLPPLKFHLGARIFLLGLIGLERVALRSSSSQAKIMGTIASISGALLVVLYKGPRVFSSPASSPGLLQWLLESSDPNWVTGGILLLVSRILFSVWYIVQTQVMEIYPAVMIVSFFYNLSATTIAVPVSLMVESELSSWMLRPSVAVIAVLYSGVFQSYSSLVAAWSLHLKGPVYVAIFSPLSIAIAAFMSAIFLGDSLHLGSVIGAIIISMGFYAVIWGKAKEPESISSSSGKVPLLEEEDNAE